LAQLYDESGMVDQKEAILASLDRLDPGGMYHQEKGASGRSEPHGLEADDVGNEGGVSQETVTEKDADAVDPVVEAVEVRMSDPDVAPERPTIAPGRPITDSSPFIDQISASFTASILGQMQDAQSNASSDLSEGTSDARRANSASAEPMETRLNDTVKKMKEVERLTPKYLKTRYDLGVAYREMGLLPDAIKEFDMVIEAGFRLGEAYAMIARCHQENNAFERAEHLLHEGLKDARCTPDERYQLQCEIDGLHQGAEEDRSRVAAEASVPKVGENDPSPCDAAVAVEKEAPSADSQPSIPAKSGTRKKRIAYL